jgi:hypothetical protein
MLRILVSGGINNFFLSRAQQGVDGVDDVLGRGLLEYFFGQDEKLSIFVIHITHNHSSTKMLCRNLEKADIIKN